MDTPSFPRIWDHHSVQIMALFPLLYMHLIPLNINKIYVRILEND